METANSSSARAVAEKPARERITIDRIGHRGDGIADSPDGPVYVPYVLPNETVEVERSGQRARLHQIVAPSPERVAPICPHFGTCGGCALQHWHTDSYRAWKRALVADALAENGIAAEVEDLIDAHGEGRRRAVLHARRGGRNVLTVGFTGRRSHMVVPIDRCPILAPSLEPALGIAALLAEPIEFANKPIDLQFTATDNGLDVDIRGSGPLDAGTQAALSTIAEDRRLARLTRHGELICRFAEPQVTMGRAPVRLPPGAFLQPTVAGETTLARLVLEAVGETNRVADLFCGVGTFALRMAENARVLAADQDEAALAALTEAAKTQGLKPVATVKRDLFRYPMTEGELVPAKVVVLDPPRQGAEAQAVQLAQANLSRIVYVSCDPGSFARDAKILTAAGYRLSRVVPIDQFRYSPHAEIVGVFDR